MSIVLALGLALAAPEPVHSTLEHRTSFDHAGERVDAHYRARVVLARRQIGSVAKPGMPSTLRCAWRAHLRIEREARSGQQLRLNRSIERRAMLEGSRPGWCGAGENAVTKEIARRAGELRAHLLAVASEDRAVLKAEIEPKGVRRGI
ncbi:hypothetical protein OMP43_13850 [Sphingomonas sp. CBMAI 2297]|uniref:hypothetical protein n=1 Tax=Sphingomonas sp. CBMAI 2297 TaxID=2991720 RepID=UPI00245497EB|nr:hypothetical protein [Sphingomonas sp. CBMAI 2297]MDH4745100.1 hypothetical protein [Sphingomonas sp. CBMAI 2297]